MMVKPVKKRAIQEWKMNEMEQPKEKVPEPMPKAIVNHIEKVPRVTVGSILTQSGIMHPSHAFHIPPHGVMIPADHHAGIRNHYVEPIYIRSPQGGISRRLSPGPPNVMIRAPEMQSPHHHGLMTPADISGLPGRGAKRPQAPQDMAAVDAKSSRKRRKPEGGTTEVVMSSYVNGSVNGSVHINEKVPPIQPIILDFEVPLPPISPTTNPPEEKSGGMVKMDHMEKRHAPEFHGAQAMFPVHNLASVREEDAKHSGAHDARYQSRPGSEHPPKHTLFKKPDINHYKSSVQTGGTRCFICQNSIIPNPKDYPVAPSGLVICTKCRKLAMSGSPVATGPPPKIQIPSRSSQSRSQQQQRIPRSPVAKSPAASLTLPRSPLPRSPMSRSPAPGSPLLQSSPSSPANTLSAPNSPASTSGLSVPGSPRYSAPSSPRYSAPSSPRNSAPSSPVSRPQGSPLPRNPGALLTVGRSPYLNVSSVSQPPSPRPIENVSGRRHSISGAHLEVSVGSGVSKSSPTSSIGALASPRSGSAADSPALMENLQLPPGREGDDATIRALLQLGKMRAADNERRTALQGADGRISDRSDLRLPRSLADISKLDQAQLLELHHKLIYAKLPSRCMQQGSQNPPQNGDSAHKHSKSHAHQSSSVPYMTKSSLSPNSAQAILRQADQGNGSPLIRSEGVVGTALPITALSSTTEDAPLKISRIIRSSQDRSVDHKRSHSPNEAQNRLRESLESLSKSGLRCGAARSMSDTKSDKTSKYYNRDSGGTNSKTEMYRGQYAVFQCHCSGNEMFFIKCPDCDFICNSIFGMDLHIAAQRHAESRVPPPRDVDYVGCEEQSGKESRADSEASHSSFETQSADTEAEGSTGGSPQRTSQEPSSIVYSPVSGSIPEAWRDQMPSRMRTAAGVVDLGSTVPHVNIPRHLGQGLDPGADLRPNHGPSEYHSPLDLSGKRSAEPPQHEEVSRERNSSKERRGGHEANGPLDLSGYKHIQTPNSQFVSSQRLGSVGSMIEKSVASSVPSLAFSQAVSQNPQGMPAVSFPGMMLAGNSPAVSGSQSPYPIPTMFAVQPSSVAGLYPLSTLAGTIPLLAPVQLQSASAPPSPNYARHAEAAQPRRASYSLAPPLGRSSKSASPTPSTLSPHQDQHRQGSMLSVPHNHAYPSLSSKVLSYQGGTITIQPTTSLSTTSAHQRTVTLESQFSHSSPATPQGSRSPQIPTPSSPAPHLSSTVPPQGVRVKSEPRSDEEADRAQPSSHQEDMDDPDQLKHVENQGEESRDCARSPKEVEKTKSPPKPQTLSSSSSSPHPAVQIKIEPDT